MRLTKLEAGAVTGAVFGEKALSRRAQRNGYRERVWEPRAGTEELRIPKLRTGRWSRMTNGPFSALATSSSRPSPRGAMMPSPACPPRHPDQKGAPNITATARSIYATWR